MNYKKPTDIEIERLKTELRKRLTCPICGRPKTHYRLYGYRCDNPEHQELENEMLFKEWKAKR